ncbi:MAG: winged helix DNA-binding domain-containing protein, partial [Bradymonadaceae bacterium]|nr:winged helix DNA-binding domain-containing protein [Lujinxingiaceae bacterium]
MSKQVPIEISEAQALSFRLRRCHLAGPGAESLTEAARSIVGAQAQQEVPALYGMSLRTATRPSALAVKAALSEPGARRLVRTWGQRDTLHLYDPADWAMIVAAQSKWPQTGRRGAIPTDEELEAAHQAFVEAGRPLLRTDLYNVLTPRLVEEAREHPGSQGNAERFAASRLIWVLAQRGDLCVGDKRGSENEYAARELWFPKLDWQLPDADEAATALVGRYLSSFAPATAADIAHFYGARVTEVRGWLAGLQSELVDVRCAGRKGLLALAKDADALRLPADQESVRLLPMFDGQLMTHKDKSWIMPLEAERPLVWRKAAMLAPSVLVGGRIVATWSTKVAAKLLTLSIEPLSGWRAEHLQGVEAEARAFA